MSAQDLEKVIVKATRDRAFRKALLTKPEEALKALRIRVTPQRVAALKQLNRALIRRLGKAFGHPDSPKGIN